MSRVEQARTDIARRRALAEAATQGRWKLWGMAVMADQDGTSNVDTALPVACTEDVRALRTWNAEHIAANDPAHVLAVLAAADATLDRHRRRALRSAPDEPYCSNCCQLTHDNDLVYAAWPCPDAAAVLDLYAPAVKR